MSDLVFSSPAKRAKFLQSIASINAKIALKKASSFAPPVESRVLGSVTTPSGASPLAGHPDCVPVTMSGDAWEAAANHVIALRDASRNAHVWQQIGSFLDSLVKRPPPHCFFPQPRFESVKTLAITGVDRFPVALRDDFITTDFFCGSLDAPEDLPQGSHDSMRFGRTIASFATVRRSRCFA